MEEEKKYLDYTGLQLYHQNIQSQIDSEAKISFGICQTEPEYQEKTVSLSNNNWSLKVGSVVGVKFANTNTFSAETGSEITINVNNTGAKQIWYDTSANPEGEFPIAYGTAGRYTYYMYDGTYWVWLGQSVDKDTLYQNMSSSELTIGTETIARLISAKVLNDWIEAKNFLTQHQDISGKVDKTTTINGHALNTNITLDKSDISLENVTNDAQVKRTEMGVADGVATLDSNGKVLSTQLPSFVDDVIEAYYYNGDFYKTKISETSYEDIITPQSGKIYTDLNSNKTYRWGGTTYVEISQSLAIGTTAGTACEGNDPRLSDSRPASDVSAWAKNPTKPTYTPQEVGVISSVISTDVNKNNQTAPESVVGQDNSGKVAHVIYKNTGTEDYTIALSTTSGYITPDGQALELTCPQNGYCEINYLNIDGEIFVRGL